MNCPKHGCPMTQLLFSWVCDVCEPSAAAAVRPATVLQPSALVPSGHSSSSVAPLPSRFAALRTALVTRVVSRLDSWMPGLPAAMEAQAAPGPGVSPPAAGMVVAGGFVRDVSSGRKWQDPRDLDLFVRSRPDMASARSTLAQLSPSPAARFAMTPRPGPVVVDFFAPGGPVQLVHWEDFTHPYELLLTFDMTCNAAAVWHDGTAWRGVAHVDFETHVQGGVLGLLRADRCTVVRLLDAYARGLRPAVPAGLSARDAQVALLAQLWSSVDTGVRTAKEALGGSRY